MFRLKTSKEVSEGKTTAERYAYSEIGMPWPFDNRDIVMHEQIVHNDNGASVIMKLHMGLVHEKKGTIRMPVAEGGWYFSKEGNKTGIRYEFLGDPGGSIPAWVVNMFIVEGPYSTLSNLKEQLEK